MNEATLTQLLVENLQSENELKKIIRNNKKHIEFRREVGTTSFRADIFITLQDENQLSSNELNNGTNFIAIEVKIKDWRQGLYQAWRYNSFAEKSYLALYKPYAANVDLSLFEEHNVGLIVFDETSIEIQNRPRRRTFRKSDSYSITLRNKIWCSLPSVQSV